MTVLDFLVSDLELVWEVDTSQLSIVEEDRDKLGVADFQASLQA